MKVVGVLLLLIAFGAFSLYGMSVTSELMQSGDTYIAESDPMYQSYETSKTITATTWGMSANGVYIIALVLVIVLLGSLVAVVKVM